MIVKDFSDFLDEKGEIPLVERIRGAFRYGSTWQADIQAQETVISRFQSALDDNFTLLRNLALPGLEVPIPIVLVGPPGVQVLYTSAIKGIYQAKGEQWNVMNTNSRRFKAARPNLTNRIMLLSQALHRHLERFEIGNVSIEPVMVFTDPGIHVDTKSPATRIVMIDALDRYAASMSQLAPVASAELVVKIVESLSSAPPFGRDAVSDEEDRLIQEAFTLPRPAGQERRMDVNLPFLGAMNFSLRQWVLLGGMMFLNMIILATLIILVLFYQ